MDKCTSTLVGEKTRAAVFVGAGADKFYWDRRSAILWIKKRFFTNKYLIKSQKTLILILSTKFICIFSSFSKSYVLFFLFTNFSLSLSNYNLAQLQVFALSSFCCFRRPDWLALIIIICAAISDTQRPWPDGVFRVYCARTLTTTTRCLFDPKCLKCAEDDDSLVNNVNLALALDRNCQGQGRSRDSRHLSHWHRHRRTISISGH